MCIRDRCFEREFTLIVETHCIRKIRAARDDDLARVVQPESIISIDAGIGHLVGQIGEGGAIVNQARIIEQRERLSLIHIWTLPTSDLV